MMQVQFSGPNRHFVSLLVGRNLSVQLVPSLCFTPGLFHRNSCPLGNHSSHICLQRSTSMGEPESLCKGMTYDGGICRSQWISIMRMNASYTSFEIGTMRINVATTKCRQRKKGETALARTWPPKHTGNEILLVTEHFRLRPSDNPAPQFIWKNCAKQD